METPPLYDLAPVARIMLLGVVIALGPLAWVWVRNRHAPPAQRLRVLTLLTLFLTFDLVLFGAFTRLTDAGLGCPDWPGCYGSVSPVGAHASISAAQEAMPTGPVTFSKAWIEMVHRYMATAVGVLILVLALVSWMERRRLQLSIAGPLLTLVWVCVQGAFGALTVTMKLFPAIVTLHLLGGMVLLALLRAQADTYQTQNLTGASLTPLHRGTGWGLVVVYGLVWLQTALGGWVSTNYAVLACSDFPTCQGGWWPPMDLHEGFTVWRELGLNGAGEPITFAALTAIHYVHRLAAYVVLTALGLLVWSLWSVPSMRSTSRALLALMLWQFASGLANVVFDWPLLAAVAHTAGAGGLVIVLTGAVFGHRAAPDTRNVPSSNAARYT